MFSAFVQTGFVYLRGHRVPPELQQDTFAAARDFFALDAGAKLRYERFVRTGYNGYTPVGGENTGRLDQLDLLDLKECYDFHVFGEDYPDDIAPKFCRQLELLGSAVCQLSSRLLDALELALVEQQPAAGQGGDRRPAAQPGVLSASHGRMLRPGGCAALRVLHYPPVPAGAQPGAVRCAAHTDYGTMSLLFQDELGGLEIEGPDGAWMAATPIPDTILVNVGDLMETWSSGRLRATRHRVVLPAAETLRRRARQSMVLFVQPDEEAPVVPLDGAARFPAVSAGAELRRKFASTYPAFEARLVGRQGQKGAE